MRMRRWVLARSVTFGLALMMLLLLGAGRLIYQAQVQAGAMSAEVQRTFALLEQTDGILIHLVDAETGQRGYFLTGAEHYQKPYDDAVRALPGETAKLRELCAGNAGEARLQARLELLARARLDELRRLGELRRGSESASPRAMMDTGRETMESIRVVVEELRGAAHADLTLGQARRNQRRMRNRAATAVTITLAAVLLGATGIALNGQTRRRMLAEEDRDRLLRAEVAAEERARAEEQARAEVERASERARRLVDANIVGVVFGRGPFLTEANDAFLRIIGYAREELAAGSIRWRALTPPELLPRDELAIAEVVERGAATPYEKEYLRKDGTRVPVLLGIASLGRDLSEGWLAFVLDLTERDRAVAAQRAAQASAEAANHAKDEFLAVLSHEMRSPLHAMVGWLSIVKKGLAQGRDVSRAIDTVERNTWLQAQLVDDLLDVSRVLSGKLVIAGEPVALAEVVRSAVENARPAAESKGVALACVGALPSAVVLGDEPRLVQVLGNLLNNAIKFTPRGGEVTVTLASDADEATLQVRDTGVGIGPELLDQVFDKFRQADTTNTRAYGGLGIGLYLVRSLVDLHGGDVTASSDGHGKGATFTVRIPLPGARPAVVAARAAAGERTAGKLAGLAVMLVEDEADSREALGAILASEGVEVYACASVAEARDALERVQPDVIVSDIGMPGENGFSFMRWLRSRDDGYVPAIALTGFASRQDADEAARAGFDEHLAKPVRTEILVARLQHLTQRRKAS